jgi:hypothetical protein
MTATPCHRRTFQSFEEKIFGLHVERNGSIFVSLPAATISSM